MYTKIHQMDSEAASDIDEILYDHLLGELEQALASEH